MKPKLKKLQFLLQENVFSGMECEEDEDHQGKKVNLFIVLVHKTSCFCNTLKGINQYNL